VSRTHRVSFNHKPWKGRGLLKGWSINASKKGEWRGNVVVGGTSERGKRSAKKGDPALTKCILSATPEKKGEKFRGS